MISLFRPAGTPFVCQCKNIRSASYTKKGPERKSLSTTFVQFEYGKQISVCLPSLIDCTGDYLLCCVEKDPEGVLSNVCRGSGTEEKGPDCPVSETTWSVTVMEPILHQDLLLYKLLGLINSSGWVQNGTGRTVLPKEVYLLTPRAGVTVTFDWTEGENDCWLQPIWQSSWTSLPIVHCYVNVMLRGKGADGINH